MKIFGIEIKKISRNFPKQAEDIEKKSIKDLTPEEKAEIEDQTAANIPARTIAANLNIDIDLVYRYREVIKAQGKNAPIVDPKLQRELLKMDLDIEHKREQINQDRIRFIEEMKQVRAEGSDGEPQEMSLEDLFNLISKLPKDQLGSEPVSWDTPNNAIHIQQSGAATPSDSSSPPAEDQYTDLSDEQIREIIGGFTKQQIKIAQKMPDSLIKDKILNDYPSISDKSINRAIEILKKEY